MRPRDRRSGWRREGNRHRTVSDAPEREFEGRAKPAELTFPHSEGRAADAVGAAVPSARGRVIDPSPRTAAQLEMKTDGTAAVETIRVPDRDERGAAR